MAGSGLIRVLLLGFVGKKREFSGYVLEIIEEREENQKMKLWGVGVGTAIQGDTFILFISSLFSIISDV